MNLTLFAAVRLMPRRHYVYRIDSRTTVLMVKLDLLKILFASLRQERSFREQKKQKKNGKRKIYHCI